MGVHWVVVGCGDERRRREVITKALMRDQGREVAVKWAEAQTLSPLRTQRPGQYKEGGRRSEQLSLPMEAAVGHPAWGRPFRPGAVSGSGWDSACAVIARP